jgi:hypothetical protein
MSAEGILRSIHMCNRFEDLKSAVCLEKGTKGLGAIELINSDLSLPTGKAILWTAGDFVRIFG